MGEAGLLSGQKLHPSCETMMNVYDRGDQRHTYSMHIYHEEFIIHRDALVYNNGKSILSTLTRSVRANSAMFVEGVKKYKEVTYSSDQLIIP